MLEVVELVAAVMLTCVVIRGLFKTQFLRAVQAWLPTILASIAGIALAFLVVRPFLYEAFVTPTNGMAPTLMGNHWRGLCPDCGRDNYCSPVDRRYGLPDPPRMICDNFHIARASHADKRVYAADRFLIARFRAVGGLTLCEDTVG